MPKNKCRNRPNCIVSTWKPGFSKINIMLSNCCLASWGNTILVDVGDLVRLRSTLKPPAESNWINLMSFRTSFGAFIESYCSPGFQSCL